MGLKLGFRPNSNVISVYLSETSLSSSLLSRVLGIEYQSQGAIHWPGKWRLRMEIWKWRNRRRSRSTRESMTSRSRGTRTQTSTIGRLKNSMPLGMKAACSNSVHSPLFSLHTEVSLSVSIYTPLCNFLCAFCRKTSLARLLRAHSGRSISS